MDENDARLIQYLSKELTKAEERIALLLKENSRLKEAKDNLMQESIDLRASCELGWDQNKELIKKLNDQVNVTKWWFSRACALYDKKVEVLDESVQWFFEAARFKTLMEDFRFIGDYWRSEVEKADAEIGVLKEHLDDYINPEKRLKNYMYAMACPDCRDQRLGEGKEDITCSSCGNSGRGDIYHANKIRRESKKSPEYQDGCQQLEIDITELL